MKNIHIALFFLLSGTSLAQAETIPKSYKAADGSFKKIQVVAPLTNAGAPAFTQYRDGSGQWMPATVVSTVCGLDNEGNPQPCDYVKGAQIGAAAGVAGLDAAGNVTAPVSTSSLIASTNLRVAPVVGNSYPNTTGSEAIQLPGYSFWWGNQMGLAQYPQGSGVNVVGDWWTTPPETLHLGGQSEGKSGFLNIHCAPYAASNSGTCAQVMMGTGNIQALAAGIGPGSSNIASYDNFDAVGITQQVGGSVPLYVITSNAANNVFPPTSDGLDHTPTFTASGATFANPLPEDMSTWLITHQQGIRLMTNEIGCQSCGIQTYAGRVTGLTQNSDGLVTGLTVAAWQVFGSGDTDSGQIPGTSVTDASETYTTTSDATTGSTTLAIGPTTALYPNMPISGTGIPDGTLVTSAAYDNSGTTVTLSNALTADVASGSTLTVTTIAAIDTQWSDYKYPAIMVGVYTKAFDMYSLCGLSAPSPDAGRGDINNPSGGANNQLRVCEGWEMDLWNDDPVDHRPSFHGLTVAYSKRSNGGMPSYDSYDFNAAGANSISYLQSGEYWTIPFSGSTMKVSSYNGTPFAAGSKKNIVQWSQSEQIGYAADGGYPRNNIMPGIWTTRNVEAGCDNPDNVTCDDPNGSSKDITIHEGVQIDWYGAPTTGADGDPLWNSPIQEQIEFNPASNHGGVNLCAGTQDDTTCTVQVSPSGETVEGTLAVGTAAPVDALDVIGSATFGTSTTQRSDFGKLAVTNIVTTPGSDDAQAVAIDIFAVGINNAQLVYNKDPQRLTWRDYNNAKDVVSFHMDGTGSVDISGTLTAGALLVPFATPASSTATCTQGQVELDAEYLYTCVAANTWHRVSTGTSW